MTNTTELRKRFEEMFDVDTNGAIFARRNDDGQTDYDQVFTFLQSEIEAVEKAKVEEVIEAVENFDAGCNEEYAYASSYIADDLREKFLTKHDDE